MKLSLAISLFVSVISAAAVQHVPEPHITSAPVTSDSGAATIHHEKRYKNAIINKEYREKMEAKKKAAESTSSKPKAWMRVVYSTKTERVIPTVIAGVTFSAKPPATTDGLEPWISLNKDGSPKTIKPDIKNGRIRKPSPTYGTWFQTASTIVYTPEEMGLEHLGNEDEVHEEVVYQEEDQTYHSLNPLIRCTPDYYKLKGVAKDQSPEPFCFPQDSAQLKQEKTYFVTWFSRFFAPEVKNVKLHLTYVKEHHMYKGTKRSEVMDKGGQAHANSFFTSDWIENDKGFYPLTIDPEWLTMKEPFRKVMLSLQPDNVSDEDFDPQANFIVIEIAKGAKVGKEHLLDLKKLEEKWDKADIDGVYDEGPNMEKYLIMMTMPTCVAIAGLLMYFFVMVNKKNTDLSHLRPKRALGRLTNHRRIPFAKKKKQETELPLSDMNKLD
ncbi:hypothetical protein PGUG_05274 [Meyerozyma guilliermondii ATCC 6260]|uniref:Uncharacterized protein n=1 Tax=Meyerozyma guilliermondii (strain ATCC 6260 / CBS 566 / DSM 6381 / JCM 1539 / NBRC 10279 / NRRL Y-324) TaxID=294746 RepID=A5DPS3_PICGU|nr:uncharacterized protein PGUG_05274 [Meyerozyma guilliermondii ATCC 6260]EDK41176.2 hypothetical protein PGUG_05274 [Meyerozyma guilliermondii ATCC 6260]